MGFLKNLKHYLNHWVIYLRTIADGTWGILLPIALLLVIKFLPWEFSNLIRYAGFGLEVLGLYTVFKGHIGKRKLFDRPTFLANTKALFAQYPRWRALTHRVSATFESSNTVGGGAQGYAWHGARDESIEAKLEAIEKKPFVCS